MGMAMFQPNFYLQKQAVGWIWPMGFPTPDLPQEE